MLGRNHAVVKRVRRLRRSATDRAEQRVYVAEGIHLAREALRFEADIECALTSPRLIGTEEGRQLRAALESAAVVVHDLDDTLLDSLQDARTAQPVCLLVRGSPSALTRIPCPADGLVVIAHDVQDPGNAGSMLRSADASGAHGFIFSGQGADPFHPRTVRAAMGSSFRLPVARAEPNEWVAALRQAGYRLAASCSDAGEDLYAASWSEPTAVVFGNEGAGLPPELREACDLAITIPLRASVESLSVAAAAAVVLFEIRRRRLISPRDSHVG